LIGSTSIHSQNTLSTKITYDKLQEFARYVAYKDSTVNVFTQYRNELNAKDNLLNVKDQKINLLSLSLQKSDSISLSQKGLMEIADIKFKSQRKDKWKYLGGGVLIGLIISLLLSK